MSSAFAPIKLDLLLRAAEYIDKKDRDIEHGYASTAMPARSVARKMNLSKSLSYRNAHNELEKTRRAQQHRCLENLKAVVPLPANVSRHTTLGLLIRARQLIKHLQEAEVHLMTNREHLIREQGRLRRQLDVWTRQWGRHSSGRYSLSSSLHSLSESSSSSVSSAMTTTDSDFFEQDEVDVVLCCEDLADDIEEVVNAVLSS